MQSYLVKYSLAQNLSILFSLLIALTTQTAGVLPLTHFTCIMHGVLLTYNYSPALVKTLARLSRANPKVRIAIAMKMRHSSEEGFFKLMSDAGFLETDKMEFPLPGDVQVGEETVYLHVYYRAFFAPT